MGARLSKDERRAVAQRILAALCAHCPAHYIALINPKLAPVRLSGFQLPPVPHHLCTVVTIVVLELRRATPPIRSTCSATCGTVSRTDRPK